MYAVLAEGAIHYLGTDREVAMTVLDSKEGGSLASVYDLTQLKTTFEAHVELKPQETSSRLDEVLQRLDEIDLAGEAEEVANNIRENSEKAIGQVRSLGLRGIKGLGEGFTALGDLLQRAGDDDEETPTTEEQKE